MFSHTPQAFLVCFPLSSCSVREQVLHCYVWDPCFPSWNDRQEAETLLFLKHVTTCLKRLNLQQLEMVPGSFSVAVNSTRTKEVGQSDGICSYAGPSQRSTAASTSVRLQALRRLKMLHHCRQRKRWVKLYNTSFSKMTHKQRKRKKAFWGVKQHLAVVVVYDL